MDEDELGKVIDLKYNIVRLFHVDDLKKAYRVPDLATKTVAEALQVITASTSCPLYGQSGVKLYEVHNEEGLFGHSSTKIEVDLAQSVTALSDKLKSGKKKISLLLAKEGEDRQQSRTTTVDVPPAHTFKLTSSKKNRSRRTALTKMALQTATSSVDFSKSRYTALDLPKQNEQQLQQQGNEMEEEGYRASRPLSQFLTAESWKEGFSIDDPQISKIRQDQQLLVSWVNAHLSERGMLISDLHKDIKDGVAFINLLEIISGKSVKEYHRKPESVQQKLQNCDLVLKFFGKLGINIEAKPKDIYNGDMSVVFGVLFALIKKVRDDKKLAKPNRNKRRAIVSIELAKDQRFSFTRQPGSITLESGDGQQLLGGGILGTPISDADDAENSEMSELIRQTISPLVEMDTSYAIGGVVGMSQHEKDKIPVKEKIMGDKDLEEALRTPENTREKKKPKQTQSEIEKMIEEIQAEDANSSNKSNATLDEILETAKRLKEMQKTRPEATATTTTPTTTTTTTAPVIQKSNINLANLNDDELEALLNDDSYDVGGEIGTLELEFNEKGPTTTTATSRDGRRRYDDGKEVIEEILGENEDKEIVNESKRNFTKSDDDITEILQSLNIHLNDGSPSSTTTITKTPPQPIETLERQSSINWDDV